MPRVVRLVDVAIALELFCADTVCFIPMQFSERNSPVFQAGFERAQELYYGILIAPVSSQPIGLADSWGRELSNQLQISAICLLDGLKSFIWLLTVSRRRSCWIRVDPSRRKSGANHVGKAKRHDEAA